MTRSAVSAADRSMTPLESRLVDVLCEAAMEGRVLTKQEAGTLAGYSENGETARVQATRALTRPHVQEALVRGLRVHMRSEAASSLAGIRHVGRTARSTRDKLQAHRTELEIAGITGFEGMGAGAGVTVQIVFRHSNGTLLSHPPAPTLQAPVIEHEPSAGHSLREGEGEDQAPMEGGGGGLEMGAQRRPGGAKTRAQLPPPGQPRVSPPKNSGAENSRGRR